MTAGVLTAEDRARARESRRLGAAPAPRPAKPREDEPPREWPAWALKERQKWLRREAELTRQIEELREERRAMVDTEIARKQERSLALAATGTSEIAIRQSVQTSPKFAKLGAEQREYVIRVSIATGLNPEFEMHAFEYKGQLVLTPDYKALMRRAKGADYLMLKERRMTDEELIERGWPKDVIARGVIGVELLGYELLKAEMARRAGVEYEPLRGIGVWEAQKWDSKQRKWVANDTPSGRDGQWVAWKRAVRALYYQIADLSLNFETITGRAPGIEVVNDDEIHIPLNAPPPPDGVVEGSYTEVSDHWTRGREAIQRAEVYLSNQGVTDAQLNAILGHDWRETHLSAEEWKTAVDSLAATLKANALESAKTLDEMSEAPAAVMPPAGVCDRCMARPVDPASPFGLCAECSEAEAASDITREASQPSLFQASRGRR